MGQVWAVVVTYNRREMLTRCLAALSAQNHPPDRVLAVDNASTDGTREMLASRHPAVEVLPLRVNLGGAGGFHHGIKQAHDAGAEWIWLMDDDTIPEPDALAQLLEASVRLGDGSPPALLASKVIWRDGRAHPMNFPLLERRRMDLVVAAAEQGVMPMRAATFVSLLLHRSAVDRFGLPLEHFFLWTDDAEYTSRIVLGGERAYFVPTSVALHDTKAPEDFRSAAPERFYFHVRNTLLVARGRGRPARDRLLRIWIVVSTSVAYIRERRSGASARAILRAVWDGLRRSPDGT